MSVFPGIHIYMVAIGIQELFILIFVFYAIKFHRMIIEHASAGDGELLKASRFFNPSIWCQSLSPHGTLLPVTQIYWLSVKMRIIFPLCEYSQGIRSNIPNHEAFQYCLDSLPMLVALHILNVFYSGRIMPGKESDIPSRKERKKNARFVKKKINDNSVPMTWISSNGQSEELYRKINTDVFRSQRLCNRAKSRSRGCKLHVSCCPCADWCSF